MRTSAEDIERMFGVQVPDEFASQPELRPTDAVVAVLNGRDGRKAALMRWGLIPHWAEDVNVGRNLFNARSESAFERPAFRFPIRKRRCLLPADSFVEWADAETAEDLQAEGQASLDFGGGPSIAKPGRRSKTRKVPFEVSMANGAPFAFAGLWDVWDSPDGERVRSCTMLTTEPNELIATVHNRMPCILSPEDFSHWLDRDLEEPAAILPMLRPYPAELMRMTPLAS